MDKFEWESNEMRLGRIAYQDGDFLSDNPYQPGTDAHLEWEDGYMYARDMDERENAHTIWMDEQDIEQLKRRL